MRCTSRKCRNVAVNLCYAVSNSIGSFGIVRNSVLQRAWAGIKLTHATLQNRNWTLERLHAAIDRINTCSISIDTVFQRVWTRIKLTHAARQSRNWTLERLHAAIDRINACSISVDPVFQRAWSCRQLQNAVSQRNYTGIERHDAFVDRINARSIGIESVRQCLRTVWKLLGTICGRLEPAADLLDNLEHRIGICFRHAFLNACIDLRRTLFGNNFTNVVQGIIGFISKFHLLWFLVQYGRCVFREVFRNRNYHVILLMTQSVLCFLCRNEMPVKILVFLELIHQLITYCKILALEFDRLILIDNGNRKMPGIAVRIPNRL